MRSNEMNTCVYIVFNGNTCECYVHRLFVIEQRTTTTTNDTDNVKTDQTHSGNESREYNKVINKIVMMINKLICLVAIKKKLRCTIGPIK